MNKTNDFKYNLPAYSDPVDIEDLNDNFRGIDDALMAGLCKKDYTGNNMGSSDPSARKYAWAPWFEIVNDNEFDVVVTDRNAPVESEEATINIAAGQTFRKYINGRYYMNFYVQDQYDVTFKWFTNAETYINESGGGGGGTGTVTSVSVQGGSGSHLTGSGNPIETSGTITINVDEGYSIPSDNEQTAWDSKAADLKFEINSSTFVITAQLKDSSGNLIGNERTIDLPLESVVVSGDYDEQTKKVILTLQNGSTIEFSVADLVSGLQTELNSNNKLNPDYIAYDASHRAVSDTEKGTWDAKQNAISDLETIRSGAAAGATAVQPSALATALAGKQDSLDQTQLAAVNSGITSEKVGQISTNQNDILTLAKRNGIINLLNFNNANVSNARGVTYDIKGDGSIIVNGTPTAGGPSYIILYLNADEVHVEDYCDGKHVLYGCPSGGSESTYCLYVARSNYTMYDTGSGVTLANTDLSGVLVVIRISDGYTANNLVFKPAIIEKAVWDSGFTTPIVKTLPNFTLTPAVIEQVDSGPKQCFDITQRPVSETNCTVNTITGVFTQDSENRDTRTNLTFGGQAYSSYSQAGYIGVIFGWKTITTNGVYAFEFTKTSNWSILRIGHNGATKDCAVTYDMSNLKNGVTYVLAVDITNCVQANGDYSWKDVMICTLADWKVSQKFVPYRPSLDIVQSSITELQSLKTLGGAFAAGASISFKTKIAQVILKRNDSNADNTAVYIVSNLTDGLSIKAVLSSENVPVTFTRDANDATKVIVTNNGNAYYHYLITNYPG